MKPHQSSKSRASSNTSSAIATRTRKTTSSSTTTAKNNSPTIGSSTRGNRLRRLHRLVDDDEEDDEDEDEKNEDEDDEEEEEEESNEEEEDDDDDEDEEIELSPGSSSTTTHSSSIVDRKRGGGRREEKNANDRGSNVELPSCFVDFDDGIVGDGEAPIVGTVCDRDLEQHPLLSDELDQLQFELEKRLTRAVLNRRKLRSALKNLASGNVSVLPPTTSASSASTSKQQQSTSSSSVKRKHPKGQQIAKKPSTSSSIASSSAAKKNHRAAGNKDRRPDSMPSCSRSYYYAQQNHQMPDKFWSFVDQYTGHTDLSTMADVLRDLVRESDQDAPPSKPYYEIPGHKSPAASKRRPSSSASGALSPKMAGGGGGQSRSGQGSSVKKSKGATTSVDSSPEKDGADGSARTLRGSDSTSTPSRKRVSQSSTPAPAPIAAKKSRTAQNGTTSSNTSKIQSNKDETMGKNGFSLGPLTERLVQALIEDCDGGVSNDGVSHECSTNGSADSKNNGLSNSSTTSGSKTLLKTLNLGNLKVLENRIKKELIEQGLLDPTEESIDRKMPNEHSETSRRESRASTSGGGGGRLSDQYEECPDDDEVTAELKRRQHELTHLQRSNHERLSALLANVESRIEVNAREDQLRAADDEVLDLCARFYGVAPTSRKPSTKKERDALAKALKDREKAINKLKACHQ